MKHNALNTFSIYDICIFVSGMCFIYDGHSNSFSNNQSFGGYTMSKVISLKNSREFGSVYNTRNSVANKYLVMYLRSNGLDYNRLGISVSKKVGNSVVRHRVTRLIREAYRLNRANIDVGYDIVIVARPASKDKKCQDIESALMHLCGLKKISHIG
ncbi:ribonuclease P protein component [Coprococcus eutactus ATCC 27759]|nr:ribonuclease P protein component [Coprococcus eutactus ATCC 27759]